MKTLILSNGQLEQKDIGNTLEALQEIVGGYIEIPFLSQVFFENDIDIIINEEGKFIDGLNKEIAVIDKETNEILDIVYGNCIFASHDEEGNTTGLSTEQMKTVLNELAMEVMVTYKSSNKHTVMKALFV